MSTPSMYPQHGCPRTWRLNPLPTVTAARCGVTCSQTQSARQEPIRSRLSSQTLSQTCQLDILICNIIYLPIHCFGCIIWAEGKLSDIYRCNPTESCPKTLEKKCNIVSTMHLNTEGLNI